MYHIALSRSVRAGYAILPGDPMRVPKIAEYLSDARKLAFNREFCTWSGELLGETVLVTSTGIGGPSASIAMEELIKLGVHTFVRIGTCGGMNDKVLAGDVVIATGAVRMEGTSCEYLPIEYPAVSDFELTENIVNCARKQGVKFHTGVVQCKDSFYGQHSPMSMPNGQELMRKWNAWVAAGCLASEMESAALFSVAAARNVRAAAVLHVVWNQMRRERFGDKAEEHDLSAAIKLAVDGLSLTIERDRGDMG